MPDVNKECSQFILHTSGSQVNFTVPSLSVGRSDVIIILALYCYNIILLTKVTIFPVCGQTRNIFTVCRLLISITGHNWESRCSPRILAPMTIQLGLLFLPWILSPDMDFMDSSAALFVLYSKYWGLSWPIKVLT